MEKQKIFWVVLSVSVFVVIVLIAGVYLLRQKPPLATTAAPPGTINPITGPGPQVFEYSQQNPSAGTGTEPKPGEPQTLHFYIGEGGEKGQGTGPQATQATPPQATPPQAPTTLTAPAAPATTAVPASPQTPSTVKPVQAPAVAPHPRTTAAAPRKTQPVVRTAVRPRQVRAVDYWIQTGSYKSQSKAEELITLLADKGLSGKVFSFDAHDGTYYRVRIGPYTNHGEADKFLSIVKQIEGLETSYVSQVTSKT